VLGVFAASVTKLIQLQFFFKYFLIFGAEIINVATHRAFKTNQFFFVLCCHKFILFNLLFIIADSGT
jgi:hypothetical protein